MEKKNAIKQQKDVIPNPISRNSYFFLSLCLPDTQSKRMHTPTANTPSNITFQLKLFLFIFIALPFDIVIH